MKREEPGQYPYARGLYKQMYKKKIWTMRQYAGFTNSEETNKRFIKLLNGGVTGLSVAFDLPTQIGYDSDDPMSAGEVGKVGVPISILDDMQNLFKDIDLDIVRCWSFTSSPARTLFLKLFRSICSSFVIKPWVLVFNFLTFRSSLWSGWSAGKSRR